MKIDGERGAALVTGAAGGLGTAFAHQLAERGHRLLLVDRRRDELEETCGVISARYGVTAEAVVVDLSVRQEVERLAERLRRTADLEVLVNNAGFGTLDYFVDTDPGVLGDMVDVHVAAPVILSRAALPGMLERNRGAIINVSSVSAWLPSAGNVSYGSTKSFLAVFSTALAQELLGTDVRVQALCPGFVRTKFHDAAGMQGFQLRKGPPARFWMAADDIVRCSLRALSGRQVIVIPGLGYRILGRLAQMPVLRPLMQWATRGPRLATCGSANSGYSPALAGAMAEVAGELPATTQAPLFGLADDAVAELPPNAMDAPVAQG